MRNLLKHIQASIFRVGWPKDERAATKAMVSSITLHVHPPKVRPAALKFRASWALGIISLVLAGALTATGVASVAVDGALRVSVCAAFAITRVAPALPL